MTVSIDGFGDPTGFSITETATLNLRVTELVAAPGDNTSTHILIEGLSPLDEGTTTYASTYSGINVDSGETQDIGIVYLEMPEGSALPEGSVSSPPAALRRWDLACRVRSAPAWRTADARRS